MKFLKKLFAPVDMTLGKPWEDILVFTLPMLLGNIAQQLYNTVDSVVVGRYVGDNALAAVGSAGPIFNLLIVLFIGISVGAGILVSQYFGAKNREELSRTIGNSLTLTACASLFVMAVATLLTRPLLELLGTPDSILDWCTSYLHIMFIGIAGMAFYNILSGILRGMGDSISALLYLLVASGLNIALDLLFVAKFEMGVAGVALATVIAQGVSAVLCMLRLMKMKDAFDMKVTYLKMTKKHAVGIIRLGVPSGLTQAIMSMAMLVVQSLTNSFGEQFIAANVIVMRVDGFAMLPNFSFGTAMTTYAGQNIGAKKFDRVTKGAKQGTFMGLAVSVCDYSNHIVLWTSAYVNFYRDGVFGKSKHEYDEDFGSGISCDGDYSKSFRCHARSRRYGDADVDFHYYDNHNSCTDRIWTCVFDEKSGTSTGKARKCIYFAFDFMDHWGCYDRRCL